MKEIFLIPKEGLIIRDPISKNILPADGAIKYLQGKSGIFWRRRIKCGDVFIKEEKEKKNTLNFINNNLKKEKEE